jgi:hypothetical protein
MLDPKRTSIATIPSMFKHILLIDPLNLDVYNVMLSRNFLTSEFVKSSSPRVEE